MVLFNDVRSFHVVVPVCRVFCRSVYPRTKRFRPAASFRRGARTPVFGYESILWWVGARVGDSVASANVTFFQCHMAFPSASEVPTTSPSHGSTSGGHVESYEAYRRKRYVLTHPGLHQPAVRCRGRAGNPAATSVSMLSYRSGSLSAQSTLSGRSRALSLSTALPHSR